MNFDIVTFGPLVVEIEGGKIGQRFDEPGIYHGPFSSGDTPIFINAAARLGAKTAMIGAVGGDDFGVCALRKLKENGVDVSQVQISKDRYTGSTFVIYYEDGSRKFLYHLDGSGSIDFDPDGYDTSFIYNAKWVHFTGFSMEASENYVKACYKALEHLGPQTKVSFDPNIRPEIYTPEQIKEMCNPILERADLVLPSGDEARLFTGASSVDEGCGLLSDGGRRLVVLKRGEDGSRFYNGNEIIDVPSYKTTEVDPTGAGDSFDAALITGFCEGMSIYEAGRFANVSGAYAVTRKGPMEGQATRAQIDEFLRSGADEIVVD